MFDMTHDKLYQNISIGDKLIFSDKKVYVIENIREHPWMHEWNLIFVNNEWQKAVDSVKYEK